MINSHGSAFSRAPDSAGETRAPACQFFLCFLDPPPPHVHRAGGRVEVCLVHRWASSLSSCYSEFFVEKWSTKSSITRFSWYVVTSTPLQECSSTLPAPAESAFHARERGYSIAVEVTCHLPGPFQSEVLNFSSWRAPQEAP